MADALTPLDLRPGSRQRTTPLARARRLAADPGAGRRGRHRARQRIDDRLQLHREPESKVGAQLLEDRLTGSTPVGETIVIHSDSATVDDATFQATVQQVAGNLSGRGLLIASDPNYYQLQAAGSPSAQQLVSQDRHSTIIPVTFSGTLDEVDKQSDAYLNAVKAADGPGIQVLTVGDISANKEFNDIASKDLSQAEKVLAADHAVDPDRRLRRDGRGRRAADPGAGVDLGCHRLGGASSAKLSELSFFVTNMISMIGLAVGIDYALFIVARYREEREHGADKVEAIAIAGSTASKAVLFSGITVVLALLGMFLIPTSIFRSLGLGAMLAVVVAVSAVLTLVPALLSLLGDKINWPRRTHYDRAAVAAQQQYDQETIHRGFWGTVARVVMTHPALAVILAVALLGAAAIPTCRCTAARPASRRCRRATPRPPMPS